MDGCRRCLDGTTTAVVGTTACCCCCQRVNIRRPISLLLEFGELGTVVEVLEVVTAASIKPKEVQATTTTTILLFLSSVIAIFKCVYKYDKKYARTAAGLLCLHETKVSSLFRPPIIYFEGHTFALLLTIVVDM